MGLNVIFGPSLSCIFRRSPPAKGNTFSRESELRDHFRRSCEAYEQDKEYSPDLLEATLISRDCRENVAQQEDLSNQLEKGDPGITSGDLCTRIEAQLFQLWEEGLHLFTFSRCVNTLSQSWCGARANRSSLRPR